MEIKEQEYKLLLDIAKKAAPFANIREIVLDYRNERFGQIMLDLDKLSKAAKEYWSRK